MEDRDGAVVSGRPAVKELAEEWSAVALADSRRRANTPFSLSLVLSMSAHTDPATVRDAASIISPRPRFSLDYATSGLSTDRHPFFYVGYP